jgi:hypothetical protein
MSLKITDGNNTIHLPEKFCIPLELKINKLGNSQEITDIGDHLYYFIHYGTYTQKEKKADTLNVTTQYFQIIKNIVNENKFK